MQDNIQQAEDLRALAALGSIQVGSDEWFDDAMLLLASIYTRLQPAPEPEPEETLEEKIARRLGLSPDPRVAPPEPTLQRSAPLVPSPRLEPSPPLVPESADSGLAVRSNVAREAQIQRNMEILASGGEIPHRAAPAANMDARSRGAYISPALRGPAGEPIISPSQGA